MHGQGRLDGKQRGLSISTKVWPVFPGMHNKVNIEATLNKSLAELGINSVDIFHLHAPDRSVPFEETLEACPVTDDNRRLNDRL